MTKKTKKIVSIVTLSSFVGLPVGAATISAAACYGGPTSPIEGDVLPPTPPAPKPTISIDEDILFDAVVDIASTIKADDWNKSNNDLKTTITDSLKEATSNKIKLSSITNVVLNQQNNTGSVSFKVSFVGNSNIKYISNNTNVVFNKSSKLVTIKNLTLAPAIEAPIKIEFNNDVLFGTIAETARKIKICDWNENNDILRQGVEKALNQASDNQICFTEFVSVNAENYFSLDDTTSLGSVSFKTENSANIENFVLDFTGNNNNVTYENNIFTITNLELLPVSNEVVPPPEEEKEVIDFNTNILFNTISQYTNSINENDWNSENNDLRTAVDLGLGEASNYKVNLAEIVSATADFSNHTGSVTFSIGEDASSLNNIGFNSNVEITNFDITVKNINLQPTPTIKPEIIDFNTNVLFNIVSQQVNSVSLNEWNNNNSTLINAINVGLSESSNYKVTLSEIISTISNSGDNTGSVTFGINGDTNSLNNIGSNFNVEISDFDITINNLSLKADAPTPPVQPDLIDIDENTLFDTISQYANTINEDDWNGDNINLRTAVNLGINDATNYMYSLTNIIDATVNKTNHTGSVTFEVDDSIDKLNPINSNPNVNIGDHNITVDNISVQPSTEIPPPVQPDLIDFNTNILFDTIDQFTSTINENDWNELNDVLQTAINQGLSDASGNQIALKQIVSTNVDFSSHLGTVTFSINEDIAKLSNIGTNSNVVINSEDITIYNLYLEPAPIEPEFFEFNAQAMYDVVSANITSIDEKEWNNENETLKKAITRGLNSASDDWLTLKQITSAVADISVHKGSVSFTINQSMNKLNVINECQNVSFTESEITIDNLTLKTNAIDFDVNIFYESLINETATIDETVWTKDSFLIIDIIDKALSQAANKPIAVFKLLKPTLDKNSHIGSVSFYVDKKGDLLNILNHNDNVLFEESKITVNNVPLRPELMGTIDGKVLYDIVSSSVANIGIFDFATNKNYWLSSAISSGIAEASLHQVNFEWIPPSHTWTEFDTNTGTVEFEVSKKLINFEMINAEKVTTPHNQAKHTLNVTYNPDANTITLWDIKLLRVGLEQRKELINQYLPGNTLDEIKKKVNEFVNLITSNIRKRNEENWPCVAAFDSEILELDVDNQAYFDFKYRHTVRYNSNDKSFESLWPLNEGLKNGKIRKGDFVSTETVFEFKADLFNRKIRADATTRLRVNDKFYTIPNDKNPWVPQSLHVGQWMNCYKYENNSLYLIIHLLKTTGNPFCLVYGPDSNFRTDTSGEFDMYMGWIRQFYRVSPEQTFYKDIGYTYHYLTKFDVNLCDFPFKINITIEMNPGIYNSDITYIPPEGSKPNKKGKPSDKPNDKPVLTPAEVAANLPKHYRSHWTASYSFTYGYYDDYWNESRFRGTMTYTFPNIQMENGEVKTIVHSSKLALTYDDWYYYFAYSFHVGNKLPFLTAPVDNPRLPKPEKPKPDKPGKPNKPGKPHKDDKWPPWEHDDENWPPK